MNTTTTQQGNTMNTTYSSNEDYNEDGYSSTEELLNNYHDNKEEEPVFNSDIERLELCRNTDCERYPPDWDFEEDTEETYQEGQWKKCVLCPGYFNADGLGDILCIEEDPHNTEGVCDLCGKTQNIVQMKDTGQYICGNACDESEEED